MHISNLRVDRFGVWTDLRLSGFCPGLNVIYGPNGSGKTTLVQFLRTMLQGFNDELRQRYLASGGSGGGGSLVVQGSFGQLTMARHDLGDPAGRLSVDGHTGQAVGRQQLLDLLAAVPASLFDRVFIVGGPGQADVDQTINAAIAHGFDMLGGDGDPQQLAALTERLEAERRGLVGLAPADGPLPELQARRRTLQQDIATLESAVREQRQSAERQLVKLTREIAVLEEQAAELERELAAATGELDAREAERRQAEEARREALLHRERTATERQERLREIDAQLERWQRVLADLETRRQRTLEEAGPAGLAENLAEADPRHYLRLLETRLDELQGSLREIDAVAQPDTCQCRLLRTTLAPSLQAMREDVYRLCNHLSQWESRAQRVEHNGELSQLQRCEAELRQALHSLAHRRQTLWEDVAKDAPLSGVTLDWLHGDHCRCQDHPDQVPVPSPAPVELWEPDPLALRDDELRRLASRRHEIQDDLDEVHRELQQLRDEQRELEDRLARQTDSQRLDARQLELRRLDICLRDAEQRRQRESAVARLEAELRALETSLRQSAILREASEILAHLTRGELRQLSISADRRPSVRTRTGERLDWQQLSSGGREQTHLSLCLALVGAYARRGVRLPLILNDALLSIDSQGLVAAASLLRDLARRGQQIFLFTRQQHIAELFHSLEIPVRHLPPLHAAETRTGTRNRPPWTRWPCTTSTGGWTNWRPRPAARPTSPHTAPGVLRSFPAN